MQILNIFSLSRHLELILSVISKHINWQRKILKTLQFFFSGKKTFCTNLRQHMAHFHSCIYCKCTQQYFLPWSWITLHFLLLFLPFLRYILFCFVIEDTVLKYILNRSLYMASSRQVKISVIYKIEKDPESNI